MQISELLLTSIKAALQFLSNGHELDPGPEVWPRSLGDTECPAATIYVSPVLPDWLKALLEKVDRLSHLNLINRGIIVVSPEVLHALNLVGELF